MPEISPELQARVDATLDILRKLAAEHSKISFANSLGAEDVVLTDILVRHFPQVAIFTLDTGRLPPETYELMQKLEQHYSIRLQYFYPDATEIEHYTRNNGINAFYNSVEMRKECCRIRKVEPLKRALAGRDAWITGQRRDQSVTRAELASIEYDDVFGLYKANPLADWKEREVWAYIKAHGIPYNALHDQFYPSIGCAPCTRAVTPGEDIRSGRWWWENPNSKECGLHPGKAGAVSAIKK